MSLITNNWKLLTMDFNKEMQNALQQQHHAAQFIALAGRFLVKQEPDDSNTNMCYLSGSGLLVGNAFANGKHLALDMNNLSVHLLDSSLSSVENVSLTGKTKTKAFEQIKTMITNSGINTSAFKNELHYKLPAHRLDKGDLFEINNGIIFSENIRQRHNADFVINEIAGSFSDSQPVRVWPHHFDTGSYIPFSKDDNGEVTHSIGIGLAIPDTMVDEPYYYLSFWSKKPVKDFSKLAPLVAGTWIPSGWNGGVLKLSDILKEKSLEAQYEKVKLFFTFGIQVLKGHYKLW